VDREIESARRRLSRLLVGCPHEVIADPNPLECPLRELREKGLEERLAWARNIDDSVVTRVLDYHDWCLAKKEVCERAEQFAATP